MGGFGRFRTRTRYLRAEGMDDEDEEDDDDDDHDDDIGDGRYMDDSFVRQGRDRDRHFAWHSAASGAHFPPHPPWKMLNH
jgi:hypothetical protein